MISLQERRKDMVDGMSAILKRGSKMDGRDALNFYILDREQEQLLSRQQQEERARHPQEAGRILREAQDAYCKAWVRAMRFGFTPTAQEPGVDDETRAILRRGEHRDMGTNLQGAYPGITSGGGLLVPLQWEGRLEAALKFYGPMLAESTPIDTVNGAPLVYPTDNDSSTVGEQINENSQVTQADVPISSIIFKGYKYSSKLIKISMELLQDSAFDFTSYLADKAGQRLGRCINPLFTNGTGTGQPQGIITAEPVGATAIGSSPNDGTAVSGGTSIGTDDMTSLETSVDPIYRIGAKYMVHPNTLAALRKVKGKQGHPVFPGLHHGGSETINNYPVITNPDMAQIGVNNITVAFGRLDKYGYRRVGLPWVQRLSERFSDFGQIAFIIWHRADGQLLDAGTHPVKTLQQAAS